MIRLPVHPPSIAMGNTTTNIAAITTVSDTTTTTGNYFHWQHFNLKNPLTIGP